jgi:hypothetical protein
LEILGANPIDEKPRNEYVVTPRKGKRLCAPVATPLGADVEIREGKACLQVG